MESSFLLPLLRVPAGMPATVRAIDAEGAMRARLHALGFTLGARVEVCRTCANKGCRRVRLRGASLVLDEAVAERVLCSPVSQAF